MARGWIPRPDWERFWPKVDAEGDCWEWTGSVSNAGYGQFRSTKSGRGKTVTAHRWAWEALVGPIPPGKQIDHLCRNRLCVNVGSHMRLATPRQNTDNGWSTARFNGLKSRCPRGHVYDRITHVQGRGPRRYCSTCNNEDRRRKRALRPPQPSRTHCKRGHPYNQANTAMREGRRRCRRCDADKTRQRYWRRKGVAS